MDLGGWLRSLGLEQYEVVFRENAIDETVLHDLTEDHLREIGIPLGARLKLLKAIAVLGARAEATRPSAGAVSPGPPVDAAERRQVTDVLRPRRLDRAFRPHGPQGFARGHRRLPAVRRRNRAALRRVCG